jgi:hypothetical protein
MLWKYAILVVNPAKYKFSSNLKSQLKSPISLHPCYAMQVMAIHTGVNTFVDTDMRCDDTKTTTPQPPQPQNA